MNAFVRIKNEECPHCSGSVIAVLNEWKAKTGIPTNEGFEIKCENGCDLDHDQSLQIKIKALKRFGELNQHQ